MELKNNILKSIVSIILIFAITLLSTGTVYGKKMETEVTARDLIMFASLAYADLEKIPEYNKNLIMDANKPNLNVLTRIEEDDLTFSNTDMVTDKELTQIESSTVLGFVNLSDENENTYDYLFYGLASTDEVNDWKIVNYAKFTTTVLKGTAQFTAMTFKKDNNIVIAYRGTDFDDGGDWLQDFCYGLVGYAGQEKVAQDYAKIVASHYIKENPNVNIYVTGHSLGGYLAQIGGAYLVGNKEYRDNVKEISYFNGMGLDFWSNIDKVIENKYGKKLNKEALKTIQNKSKSNLENWIKNYSGKVICYHIKGDLISSLGTHVGEKIGFEPYSKCLTHHNGKENRKYANVLATTAFSLIKNFLNEDLTPYVKEYKPKDLLTYVWITHETDSFFGALDSSAVDVSAKMEAPSLIRSNKVYDVKLEIAVINSNLSNKKLTKDNFKYNTSFVNIESIDLQKETKEGNDTKYTYKLKIKGGKSTGTSNIELLDLKLANVNNNDNKQKDNIICKSNKILTLKTLF